jgi:uncharacterized repeat protein (TIGR01451 family)
VVSDTLPVGFTFVSMGAGSLIMHDPSGVTGTIVWDQTAPYVVSANDTFTVAYNVRAEGVVRPEPYENRVEARLATGEILFDTEQVQMVGPEIVGDKQASAAQVRLGRTVDYAVILENTGTAPADLTSIVDTLPAGFTFDQMLSGPLPAPSEQGNKLVWGGPIAIPDGQDLQFSYRVIAGGTVGQVHTNSVQAAFDGQLSDSFQASVTVLPYQVHLPLMLLADYGTPPYRLAYDSKPGGDYEIWAINADKSDEVNVSNLAGGDGEPDWSPDGSKIVWVHFVDGKGDIHVANADGTDPDILSNDPKTERGPVWSPDGTKIAYFRIVEDGSELHWEVFWMDAATGSGQTQLTDRECQSHDPVWSPDGTKLAYICGLDHYAEIWVMDVASQTHTRLTRNDVEDKGPAWSPDSTRLVYVRHESPDSELYIVDVATEVSTPLTNNSWDDHGADWSPDGTKIAFSTYLDGSYEIATIDVATLHVVNLTQTGAGIADYVPRWSPDGAMILFVSNRDGNKELYVMNADGSGQFRLTDTTSDESSFVWRPQ